MHRLILTALVTAVVSADATPQSALWPAHRSGAHAMAFDSKRGVVLLYGDRASDATTLWSWDGMQWRPHDADGPGLRRHIKLAYDEARDRLVLHGGYDDAGREIHGDTWEWDGRGWHRFQAPGPGPRSSYSMVYDPDRKHVVLFGGLSPEGVRNDTWTWNGVQWTKVADTGPSPRGEAGAAFDHTSRQIVLSGGMAYRATAPASGRVSFSLNRADMPGDTWAWDGRAWRTIHGADSARMAPVAFDPVTNRLLRIAGESVDGTLHGDTFVADKAGWTLVPGATVPARHGGAVATDTRRRRIVLFGGWAPGQGALADLWEWDGVRWTRVR